jgi:hypothetical protein
MNAYEQKAENFSLKPAEPYRDEKARYDFAKVMEGEGEE